MQAVMNLIERILPGHSGQFEVEEIHADGGRDTYELDGKTARLCYEGIIRGLWQPLSDGISNIRSSRTSHGAERG